MYTHPQAFLAIPGKDIDHVFQPNVVTYKVLVSCKNEHRYAFQDLENVSAIYHDKQGKSGPWAFAL
jgi:hemerythrin superfamily protein